MNFINNVEGFVPTSNFVFKQRTATIKLRRAVRNLIHQWSDAEEKLKEKYQGNYDKKEYSNAILDLSSEYNVKIFKVILDDTQFNTDEKEVIATDWNDGFWENQDIEAIESAVRQFRLGAS